MSQTRWVAGISPPHWLKILWRHAMPGWAVLKRRRGDRCICPDLQCRTGFMLPYNIVSSSLDKPIDFPRRYQVTAEDIGFRTHLWRQRCESCVERWYVYYYFFKYCLVEWFRANHVFTSTGRRRWTSPLTDDCFQVGEGIKGHQEGRCWWWTHQMQERLSFLCFTLPWSQLFSWTLMLILLSEV